MLYTDLQVEFSGGEWHVSFPNGEIIDIPDDDLQPIEDERMFYAAVLAIYKHKEDE